MVPAGNPCAELESWSGLIAGRTIPHPDTVWRWVPGDCMHTHTFVHAHLHTQPVSAACLLCLLLCFLVLLRLLLPFCFSCLQILWLMDMILFFVCFAHTCKHCWFLFSTYKILLFFYKPTPQTVLSYFMHGLCLMMFILSMQTFPWSCQIKVLRMQQLTDVC